MRINIMTILSFVFIGLIGYLSYDIVYGKNGYEQYKAVHAQLDKANYKSSLLQKRNIAVEEEIADLKQGNMAIEDLARSELGLIYKDEIFFRVIRPQNDN